MNMRPSKQEEYRYTIMDKPFLSVIMSAYNADSYIEEAIQSILDQTFRSFEFIIIDDASTDSTSSIISSFQDNRIICLRNEKNLGLTRSLNKGILQSKCGYIVRMDADDYSSPERLEVLVSELMQNPKAGIICSRAWISHENSHDSYLSMKLDCPEEIYVNLQFKNCLMHSSVLIKREVFEKSGMYDESFRYAQDYELWNRLSKSVIIHQIHTPLITWRAPSDKDNQKKNEQWAVAEHRVFHQSCEYYFGTWYKYIPKNGISTIKSIIGPNPNNVKNIPILYLLISRLIFWILLRKIIQKSPRLLNRKKVDKYIRNWKSVFYSGVRNNFR